MKVTRITQRFPDDTLPDVGATVRGELDAIHPRLGRSLAGARIALAVGSRGIADLAVMVRAAVSWARAAGAEPFIVPAMGSHGGATAGGQAELLAGYGVDEAGVGAPVHATMDVVELPSDGLGHRLFLDAHAAAADGILLLNRIKPHTDYHGPVESGLQKMCVIGLGKQRGAEEIHALGTQGLRTRLGPGALRLLESGRVLLGLAVVENAHDKPCIIRALLPREIPAEEARLLAVAGEKLARLPVDDLDVLVVDELGKDVSGTGMDTNIIGRMRIEGEPEPSAPRIRRIVVLGLTPGTHGNATGIGLADFITNRVYEQMDPAATYENVLTSTFIQRAMIPIVAPTARTAVAWAVRSLGMSGTPEVVRLAHIRDTMRLEEIWVTDPVLPELAGHPRVRITADRRELPA
jgi:hypothetical protein